MPPSNTKRAGRSRDEQLRKTILAAALALATEQPYASITMEGIAARSGAGKQTLYRWWPTTAAVVLDALLETANVQIVPARTADPRADLRAFLAATFRVLSTPVGQVLRRLMAEAQMNAAFAAEFRERLIAQRREALLTLLRRLAPEEEGELLADLVFGAMWYRLLVGHAPLDDVFAARIVGSLPGRPSE